MSLKTLILAAGQGTRMKSELPKVLHQLGPFSLLEHVFWLSKELKSESISIVYGHGGEQTKETLSHLEAEWVLQAQQLGTGHAVMQVETKFDDQDRVLILYGDVPLLKKQTITNLLEASETTDLALLTVKLDNPFGYGRIVRDGDGKIIKIVEQKDAAQEELEIDEVNTGILVANGSKLKDWLNSLDNNNAQQEYYLTDIIEMAVKDGVEVKSCHPQVESEVLGVNNRSQLAYLERIYQEQKAEELMEQGVTFKDPGRFDLRGELVSIGKDVVIDINLVVEGKCKIGNRVTIGPNVILKDAEIADDVQILANSMIESSVVGQSTRVGPYARLRPGTELAENVHIGNFVETKKTTVAKGSKINHLSYIGDCEIGTGVNVGAGTITCNYDGVNKFKTVIEDGAFIGSDTQLVAPVIVTKNTTVGAGSTITKNTAEDSLVLSRSKQITVKGWKRPVKKG